jgi:serine/threonine-protein kinase
MLSSHLAADTASRDLIRAEAQAAGRLSHPHITNVYDYGEALEPDGTRTPFVVMELVNGVTLDSRLAKGPLPWPVTVRITAEVAAALTAAHARGLVHRDIKPANVMLTAGGVKVVDFGISAVVGAHTDKAPVLRGTPGYLAPERLCGSAVTPASDVYALGLLLFRTLTGRLPWRAETMTQMIQAHRYTDPQPLPPVPGLPAEIVDLCARCLRREPGERPSAAEAARTLAAAVGTRAPIPHEDALAWEMTGLLDAQTAVVPVGVPVVAADSIPEVGRARHRRRPRVPAVAAGSAVAAVVVVGLAASTWPAAGREQRQPAAGQWGQAPAVAAGSGPGCEVRYQTRKDEGGAFAIDLAVINASDRPAEGWALRFDFPGDQALTGVTGAAWTQSGSTVTVRGDAALAAGGAAAASLTGAYGASNPLPTAFTLNDLPCRTTVTGAAAVPASVTGNQSVGRDAGAGSGAGVSGSGPRSGAGPGIGAGEHGGNAWQRGRGGKDNQGDHGGRGD